MNNYSLITGHNYQTTYDLHVPAANSHTMQLNESSTKASDTQHLTKLNIPSAKNVNFNLNSLNLICV